MAKLFLLRHIKSQWNKENRFAGWTDGPLSEEEIGHAKFMAEQIFKYRIDKIFTSVLFRNMETVAKLFEFGNKKYPIFVHLDKGKMKKWGNYVDVSRYDVPIFVTEALNERYYGKIQGENRDTAAQKYGKELVHLWRRSYDIAPPGGESLKDVVKRVAPFFKKYPERSLREGKNVLIVASHNSLRAIAKYVEKISDEDIINLEIPHGGAIVYDFDGLMRLKSKKDLV
jgi:2,3-bisphosphoglycerate-dependent phosphoglycerate mutase